MNNEEKILALLEGMDKRLEHLEVNVSDLKAGQAKLETNVSELRAEMNERFDSVELSIKEAWKDIEIMEDRVDIHAAAIKKIM